MCKLIIVHLFAKLFLALCGPKTTSEIIFTLSAETEAEVNELAEQVKKAGGNIFHEAGRDENGYYGFVFADPEGHRFDVLLMDRM